MQISFPFKLKSHPDKLLYLHLKNVAKLSKEIVENKKIENKTIISEISYLIGLCHDFGKGTTYFQKHLTGEKTEKAYHGFLSALFTYFVIDKYLSYNKIDNFNFLPIISFSVVLSHHIDLIDFIGIDAIESKLDDLSTIKSQILDIKNNYKNELGEIYSELNFLNLERFLSNFRIIAQNIKRNIVKICMMSKNLDFYFYTIFLYSILLDADKLDVLNISPHVLNKSFPKNLVENYKKIKFLNLKEKRINNLREESYKEALNSFYNTEIDKNRIFTIELPTGCGKTLLAYSTAFKLQNRVKEKMGFIPKIIYSLPFLSIIEQNAEVLLDVFKQNNIKISSVLLLKHHHMSDISYTTSENIELDINKSSILTEGWHSSNIITTFIQLFHSLITNRNKSLRKFHNIINSIIILDEIQAIPYKYWDLIKVVLKYIAYEFNSWIIFVTATQPFIFSQKEITPLIKKREKYFNYFNRYKYQFDTEPKEWENFKKEITEKATSSEENLMIVLNTISSVKDLYSFLKKSFENLYGNSIIDKKSGLCKFKKLILGNLTTHIIPKHRIARINKLKEEIKNKKNRVILITTQLIEAGVDISFNILYRDIAPLDSIIQSAGRCNRNWEEKYGTIKIVNLKKGNYFFHRIYNSTLIEATKEILKEKDSIDEKEFNVDKIKKYYNIVRKRGSIETPSQEIINYLKELKFSEIRKFKLIEEKYLGNEDIFVEIDSGAKELRKKREKILKLNIWDRKKEFLKIKPAFYNYIISVSLSIAKKNLPPEEENLRIIPENQINEFYDIETGFKTESSFIW